MLGPMAIAARLFRQRRVTDLIMAIEAGKPFVAALKGHMLGRDGLGKDPWLFRGMTHRARKAFCLFVALGDVPVFLRMAPLAGRGGKLAIFVVTGHAVDHRVHADVHVLVCLVLVGLNRPTARIVTYGAVLAGEGLRGLVVIVGHILTRGALLTSSNYRMPLFFLVDLLRLGDSAARQD